mmetsp:Transcript_13132/g.17165  ORF Transcript_13132/g.17165 Transcript_13132/m.17165 type:complete len:215 (+) Transcript_13132:1812-2456(+)
MLTPSFTCKSANKCRTLSNASFRDVLDLNRMKNIRCAAIGVGDAEIVMKRLLCLFSPLPDSRGVLLFADGNSFESNPTQPGLTSIKSSNDIGSSKFLSPLPRALLKYPPRAANTIWARINDSSFDSSFTWTGVAFTTNSGFSLVSSFLCNCHSVPSRPPLKKLLLLFFLLSNRLTSSNMFSSLSRREVTSCFQPDDMTFSSSSACTAPRLTIGK